MLCGSTDILQTVCDHLGGIKPGETTKDRKFTVVEVECQGACSNAPMMVVNDDFYVSHLFSSYSKYRTLNNSPVPHVGGFDTIFDEKDIGCFRKGRKG
jgi:hypothetical protein